MHPWQKERKKNWLVSISYMNIAVLVICLLVLVLKPDEVEGSILGTIIGAVLVVMLIRKKLPPFD